MPRSIAHGHWHAHVNGVNAAPVLQDWLTDKMSLTDKLTARSNRFRVKRLYQGRAVCLADESAPIGMRRPCYVQEREVLLECDGRPMVFAHTVVPLDATASDWPFFNALGERSLGTTLFGDPLVRRGTLQFARLRADHPLAQRACAATKSDRPTQPLFARRCLFRRKNGLLLVTEVFLPGIQTLDGEPAVTRGASARHEKIEMRSRQ